MRWQRRGRSCSMLLAACVLASGAVGATQGSGRVLAAPAGLSYCQPNFYQHQYCHIAPSGYFAIVVPGTHIELLGKGTQATRHTAIWINTVQAPWRVKGGKGFSVFSSGRMPALRLAHRGKLFRYVPSKGKLVRVNAITRHGIYEVVVR